MREEILKPYKGKIFIETGAGGGSGIQCALKLGFQTIYSIEMKEIQYEVCRKLFKDNPEVIMIYGDSRDKFPELLKQIKEPATIFLDAHTGKETTIMEELKALQQHPIKTHTLLIDDLKIFSQNWNVKFHDLLREIERINIDYKLKITGPKDHPNHVLVAEIK